MGCVPRPCKNSCFWVAVFTPAGEDKVCCLHQKLWLLVTQSDNRHGPLDDSCFNLGESLNCKACFHGGTSHGEGVVSSLEMLVTQNGASYDGQVCVGAYHVVGELSHKVKELTKGRLVDGHGSVSLIQQDTMLVVVYVGRILEAPSFSLDGYWNNAVSATSGMVQAASVAFVFHTELALGITALRLQLGCSNGLGILFWLGQVDGNVQVTVFCGSNPLHVTLNSVTTDVVVVLGKVVEPVGGRLRRFLVQSVEFGYDL